MSSVVDKYGAIYCGYISVAFTFSGGCITLFCYDYFNDPDIGSIYIAIFVIFLLYIGWESFFIINQILCVQNSDHGSSSFIILLNYVSYSFGLVAGSYIAAVEWNGGKGLMMVSVIWILCAISTGIIYKIMKCIKDRPTVHDYQPVPLD